MINEQRADELGDFLGLFKAKGARVGKATGKKAKGS